MRFSDISGHTREIETLRRAVTAGCTAHAYLFSGPEGVGKRTTALALASALNCTARTDGSGDGCGECSGCRSVGEGRHPNVVVVEPEKGIIKIDRMREVADGLRFKVGSGRKVVIVDGADVMNLQASNAFLKTLEEPPPDSLIVLLTSRPSHLLPTILSRCQRMNFRPLADDVLAGLLGARLGIAPDEALTAARLSGGSLARALSSFDEDIRESRRASLEMLSSLDAGDTASILDAAAVLSKRDDLTEVLEFLKTWYRDRAVAAAGVPELAINAVSHGGVGTTHPACGFDAIWRSYTAIEKARESITPPRYANKLLAMETMLIRIAENGGAC